MMEEIKKRFLTIGSSLYTHFWARAEIWSIFYWPAPFFEFFFSAQSSSMAIHNNLQERKPEFVWRVKIEFFILMTDDDDDEFWKASCRPHTLVDFWLLDTVKGNSPPKKMVREHYLIN